MLAEQQKTEPTQNHKKNYQYLTLDVSVPAVKR